MAISHHIGLEIAQNAFRLVEIRTMDDFPTILRADSVETSHKYGSALLHDIPFDYELAKAFIRDLTALLQKRKLYADTLSVSLPFHAPLIATLPVDAGLTPEEKRGHFLWECRTLSALDPEIELQIMPMLLDRHNGIETHLVVSLPKSTIQFLKSTFLHLTFSLQSIDIDHFILERSVRRMMPQAADGTIAVFGVFENYCLVGVYRQASYRGFRLAAVSYKENYLRQALTLLDSILATEKNLNIDQIYVYGAGSTKIFQESLAGIMRIPVTVFDPFSRFSFLAESDAAGASRYPPHTFDVAVCAAWKED